MFLRNIWVSRLVARWGLHLFMNLILVIVEAGAWRFIIWGLLGKTDISFQINSFIFFSKFDKFSQWRGKYIYLFVIFFPMQVPSIKRKINVYFQLHFQIIQFHSCWKNYQCNFSFENYWFYFISNDFFWNEVHKCIENNI